MPKDAYQTTDFYGKQHYYKVYCSAAKGTVMQSYCSLHLIGWYHEPDLLNKVPPDLSGTQLANAVSNCKLTDICRLQWASSWKGADS